MDDFIHAQGLIFLPHILRRLANRFTRACDAVFPSFGITVPPRAASTIQLLFTGGPRSVTEIAEVIQQPHPLLISWIRQLKELGMVETSPDQKDRRRTIVMLTQAGKRQAQLLLDARPAFEAAYRRLMRESDAEIFDSLWRLEGGLRKEDFAARIAAERQD
jgi:DNA-binding MarR family transcriptional regulator